MDSGPYFFAPSLKFAMGSGAVPTGALGLLMPRANTDRMGRPVAAVCQASRKHNCRKLYTGTWPRRRSHASGCTHFAYHGALARPV